MQRQTQTYAGKVRQGGRGHTRGPPLVWAYLGLIKSLQQRGNALGTPTAQGISSNWARLELFLPTQIWDEVRLCRLDKTYKADVKRITLNFVSPEKRSRSTRASRGRTQVRMSSTHSHGTKVTDFPGRSLEYVKIMVKTFFVERGVQTNSKAWHNSMQSEHMQRMAIDHAQRPQ